MIDTNWWESFNRRHRDRMESWHALDRHLNFMRYLDNKAEIARLGALAEIRMMFAKAFPNRYYAFLVQRPQDKDPWPLIFKDAGRADAYEHRVSPVREVLM